MKMILLSCCSQVANWQEVINTIPCLLWGVMVLLGFWLLLKYVAKPLIQNCNDAKVRKEKFVREKFWKIYDKIELVSDKQLKEEIDGLKKEIDKLNKKKSDLNKANSEKEALLKKELKIYDTILERLNVMICVDDKDNKQ